MKLLLSAAALLAVVASPALAEEALTAEPQSTTVVVEEIVPASAEPSMSEVEPAAATSTEMSTKASAKGGHGCGAKNTVYLTN